MEHIANPSDDALQDSVERALRAALGADATHVGVATDHGTVTLTGQLPSNSERQLAHAATLSIEGVHSIADDIVVRDSHAPGETDTELARLAQVALQKAEGVTPDSVIAEVRDHVVTLTGTVASSSERLAAERAVTYLPGLTKIDNRVSVRG
jgi:osmotically-inducible protein OsmY